MNNDEARQIFEQIYCDTVDFLEGLDSNDSEGSLELVLRGLTFAMFDKTSMLFTQNRTTTTEEIIMDNLDYWKSLQIDITGTMTQNELEKQRQLKRQINNNIIHFSDYIKNKRQLNEKRK